MNQTNAVFIITFAMIALGFFLKKFNYITEPEGKTISKFLMHTTFPALMLISTARVKLVPSLLLIPIFSILLGVIMLLVAWYWFANYPNALRGVLTMGTGGFNTGLFGFPIIEGLFGKENLVYAIMFDIGNIFIVFGAIYTIGNYFSDNKKEKSGFTPTLKKVLLLPPVMGTLIGLIINLSSIQMPTLCVDFLDILAKANKPIVLLLMGIYLSFDLDKKLISSMFKVLVVRFGIGFIAVAGLYYVLAPFPTMRNILMICAILPIGLTILPFSDEFNFDSRVAGTLLNISLLASFVLMWLMVSALHLG